MTIRTGSALAAVGVLAVALALADDGSHRPDWDAELLREVMDQPPAKDKARDNLAARSPVLQVATGPYVSIQVNVDAQGQNIVGDAANEPTISVNPSNPNNMVVGWRQFDSIESNFRQAGYAYTLNRGATWTFPGSLTPGTFRSDPVIDVNSSGTFFYQTLTFDLHVEVFRSIDGGAHWIGPVPSHIGDKNWLVIDRTGGPGQNNQYGISQRFAQPLLTQVLVRSTNNGFSYSGVVAVARYPTFGTITLAPGGTTLYAAGVDFSGTSADRQTFVLARHTDPTNTNWAPATEASTVELGGALGPQPAPNPVGLLGQANVAVDHSSGPTRGNVYYSAAVAVDGFEPSMVSLARSTDGGQTFSPYVRVNDDPINNDHWHWLAMHAVAPNGRIDMIWLDTRESEAVNLARLYYSYSWDGGSTWSANIPVSPQFNTSVGWPQQNKIGEYMGLVSDATGADVAYPATFNGEQDIYYLRLFPDCNGNGLSDITDLATHVSQDCNLSSIPDECESAPACLGAGRVPELTVNKGAGESLSLSWTPSCVATDSDYAVYEGALGSFASHVPRACTTGGALSLGLVPSGDGAYYLVVPVHADREGSFGETSAGAERPTGTGACAAQEVHACGG